MRDERAEALANYLSLVIQKARHDKGGPGSGNFGHAGRPGSRGGSASGGGGGGGEPREFTDAKGATKWLGGNSSINPDLTSDENDALELYKGSGFEGINAELREGNRSLSPETKLIDAAMDKSSLDEAVVVWRGGDMEMFEELDYNLTGEIVKDAAFVSTSLDREGAETFASSVGVKIFVPAGARALNMERHQGGLSGESELLLDRDARFKVLSDNDSARNRQLVLELIT